MNGRQHKRTAYKSRCNVIKSNLYPLPFCLLYVPKIIQCTEISTQEHHQVKSCLKWTIKRWRQKTRDDARKKIYFIFFYRYTKWKQQNKLKIKWKILRTSWIANLPSHSCKESWVFVIMRYKIHACWNHLEVRFEKWEMKFRMTS